MARKPLEMNWPGGVTVRDLLAFLRTANPDSLVVVGDCQRVRRVELDVYGVADATTPIARLKLAAARAR